MQQKMKTNFGNSENNGLSYNENRNTRTKEIKQEKPIQLVFE